MQDPWYYYFFAALTSATGVGVIAHAVNTFPTPKNKYGIWFLGVIQYIVGQRTIANNTFQGLQTESLGVTTAKMNEIKANGK
jgi:hypothetical protein